MATESTAALTSTDRLERWVAKLTEACSVGCDSSQIARLFFQDCYWRDLVLFTWDIQTTQGRESTALALHKAVPNFVSLQLSFLQDSHGKVGEENVIVEGETVSGWFSVETAVARGVAKVTLRPGEDGADRCSVFFTSMQELKGHEEPSGFRRPLGHVLGSVPNRLTWQETCVESKSQHPYVLIVGGSQSGLMLAARLKRLNVPTVVVDKLTKPGDSWRNRYSSLHLHDAIWLNDMPYMPFPDHFPVYLSKDQYADWLDLYAQAMDIDFRGRTEVVNAQFDAQASRWKVAVRAVGCEEKDTAFYPTHMVLAVGNCVAPNVPSFPGLDTFAGTVVHSSQFPGCRASASDWKGKKCVVVGSNTSAHDISQDLTEHGADVTMLQRSPTCVVKTERMRELAASAGYSEEHVAKGVHAPQSDLRGAATPFALRVEGSKRWVEQLKREDADFYKQLDQVGWQQTWGEDETGCYQMFVRNFRGYYFDIGASKMVAEGRIKLRSGPDSNIAEVKSSCVRLAGGQDVKCDVLILATGYKNMTDWVAKLISPDVAKAVGPCWGLGSGVSGDPGPWQGELRNMWKPTKQPGLWFQGGNIGMCRFHSLHLALQLKARFEGIVKTPPQPQVARAGA
eukprot:TRINITY_DN30275_c0_g1_i2.p1 TRINITY_DN30275_c0_g1~~TRINITY_DN30275_c0_g1_i2.p1  ORF type:complete len:623 (+),score=85.90 TRINITY_DN30275_c0_g1_i2:65-1933(+)